ncbi:MAG TPA: glycosyltransferase [Candidatus Thermoplasmatota archaeon]|nr:glycosyltransferase [Candidatus Thermoplasmatota archaeon]
MKALRLGVTTQTPLIRFGNEPYALVPNIGVHGRAIQIQQGQFDLSPGGVSRMVLQSLREWHRRGFLREAHWFSLQPSGPENVSLPEYGIDVHHLRLPDADMKRYARVKEKLWADIHGLESPPFDTEDFRFYARYNWTTGDAVMARAPDLDAVYVHDFQLLQVGAMVGLTAPSVLRWHVPFHREKIPAYTRNFIVRLMEDFDGVIVSTRRDLQNLTNSGFRGTVLQQYPHTDLQDWPTPSKEDVAAFEAKAGLDPDTPVVLCVARMDPIKRHDVLLRAMARIRHKHPEAVAVFVGNGSFSANPKAGLGLGKATLWREKLEEQTRELGLQGNVVFTGWVPDRIVTAAYQRASVLVLPSDIEGFGLTTYEAWAYRKPAVISSGCGSAEIVQDGLSGYTFEPEDDQQLANHLDHLLSKREFAERMGEAGNMALQNYTVKTAAPRIFDFIQDAIARSRRR